MLIYYKTTKCCEIPGKKLSGGDLRAEEKKQRKVTGDAQKHYKDMLAVYKAKHNVKDDSTEAQLIEAAEKKKRKEGHSDGMLSDAKAGISEWFLELGPNKMTMVYSLAIAICFGSAQFYFHATKMAGYLSEPQIIVRNSA